MRRSAQPGSRSAPGGPRPERTGAPDRVRVSTGDRTTWRVLVVGPFGRPREVGTAYTRERALWAGGGVKHLAPGESVRLDPMGVARGADR